MSNGNAFWAAGKHIVTSPNSPTPTSVETPNKSNNKSPTQQKNGLVSKNRNNGSVRDGRSNSNGVDLASAGIKKASWADEEEDERFLALLVSQKDNPVVSSLGTTVNVKDELIEELEATIVTKDLRIAELEAALRDSHGQIEELEEGMQVKGNTVKKLEKENHVQFLQIQELHRESTEKDERIQSLESALKRLTATQDLQQTSSSDIQSSTKSDDVKSTEIVKPKAKTSSPTVAQKKSESVKTPEPKQAISNVTELASTGKTKDDQIERSVNGPSSHDIDSPTFVTKETLKVVPPVPKPRVLIFPIDMSKYGKKPAVAVATKNQGQSPRFMEGKGGQTTSWSRSPKQARVKTDVKPNFNPSADIRHMSSAQRVLYGNGPDVSVKLGDVELKTLPQYILMQCSGKAFLHFTTNPGATSWSFPAGSMDADAAKSLLNWMDEMTYQGRVYSVTLNSAPVNDQRNIQICRAARLMGLNNSYVGHFTKHFCERIRDKDVPYELSDLVCKFAYPENDPVFDCLANKLAMQKAAGSVQGRAVLEKLAATYPVLRTTVEKIERKMGATRARK
ncbi:hypothetical protein COCC4DRAFT_37106 [Bipolaris maydis ATCC 48331]|uniref:Uncharacterized protein n=2 Tax=Cochliobolus heterostrophus TaxID=5016 RepID=M2SXT4_COCH5|nr:uncharacterized protein COCC4DRAFT_37106 [Bipolaris maydis ATCC 48331]EMD90205.1 hypothetical protein COCHEDRAFT_1105271 [Bipolaris maydis C5]KAH7555199.1 hypothetical protein BM1_06822 [Bipolaris maydis]ENI09583.1 hypothetical protein COCC4DRAFT_37106 [Bipolaris maydis ATCC 48331]KAJ5023938.1 hypothetical protein J3E73DRAFT_260134 [Bipolaris maydis]KAJ5058107.1 hypothetical protein J3E74DRAFT_220794 [Bipolaris maydis]